MFPQLSLYEIKSYSNYWNFTKDWNLLMRRLDVLNWVGYEESYDDWFLEQIDLLHMDMTRGFPGCSFGSRLTEKQKASNRYFFERHRDLNGDFEQTVILHMLSLPQKLFSMDFDYFERSLDSTLLRWMNMLSKFGFGLLITKFNLSFRNINPTIFRDVQLYNDRH